jgi:hypothetical protein
LPHPSHPLWCDHPNINCVGWQDDKNGALGMIESRGHCLSQCIILSFASGTEGSCENSHWK